jgi:hypothetical protein
MPSQSSSRMIAPYSESARAAFAARAPQWALMTELRW